MCFDWSDLVTDKLGSLPIYIQYIQICVNVGVIWGFKLYL